MSYAELILPFFPSANQYKLRSLSNLPQLENIRLGALHCLKFAPSFNLISEGECMLLSTEDSIIDATNPNISFADLFLC
jgi:hypothetical protein